MKTKLLLIASAATLLMACEQGLKASATSAAESPAQKAPADHTLTVKLSNITKQEGNIKLYIYRSSDNLLSDHPSYLEQSYSLEQAKQPIVLTNVPSGDYAIFVLQDLDDNSQLAMNRQGVPQEPYGYSNNPILMGPPTMEQVKFSLNQDTTTSIRLN